MNVKIDVLNCQKCIVTSPSDALFLLVAQVTSPHIGYSKIQTQKEITYFEYPQHYVLERAACLWIPLVLQVDAHNFPQLNRLTQKMKR